MSHHHEHDHDHHHHHHDHDHDHHHQDQKNDSTLTFEQKLDKILHHWEHHNTDHANTYTEWQHKAEAAGMTVVAEQLRQAAKLTLEINRLFAAAATAVKEKK